MLRSYQKSTGISYARTVALALTGIVASPVALFLSRPVTSASALIALAFTMVCMTLAWDQWRRKSGLTILSITTPRAARAK